MYEQIVNEIKSFSEPEFAEWFKPFLSITSDEQDIILGVRVPILRGIAKQYSKIDNTNLKKLLQNKYHEVREVALFIMVLKSKKEPEQMCELYLTNLKYINNWDLIDYTAPHIVAPVVSKKVLRELANSDDLWANRIAMVSTIYYIKQGDFSLALEFSKKFMKHSHHLIHKASGWMLREVGKKNADILKDFLHKYADNMPSVMKSYAIERLRKEGFYTTINKNSENTEG